MADAAPAGFQRRPQGIRKPLALQAMNASQGKAIQSSNRDVNSRIPTPCRRTAWVREAGQRKQVLQAMYGAIAGKAR